MYNLKIYTIVVTYNGANWIEKCLDSLKESSIQTKIIIVDNNSTDETLSIVQNKYSNNLLIKNSKNIGFGKANNIGLKIALEADADYILLLNQDSWICKDTLSLMIEQFQKDPAVGILAPINRNKSSNELELSFANQLNEKSCPNLISDLFFNRLKSFYEINFINASCWLISLSCLKTVGGFDSIFSHYGEDVNYCMRAKFHGFKVGISTLTYSCHAKDNYKPAISLKRLGLRKIRINYLNTYLLNKLTDLKLNFFQVLIEEILALIQLIIKYIIKLKLNYIIIYTGILFFVVKNTFRIIHHRTDYLSKHKPFLLD